MIFCFLISFTFDYTDEAKDWFVLMLYMEIDLGYKGTKVILETYLFNLYFINKCNFFYK